MTDFVSGLRQMQILWIVCPSNQFIGAFIRTIWGWLSVIKIFRDIGINLQQTPGGGDFKYPTIWNSDGFVTDNPIFKTDSIKLSFFWWLGFYFYKFSIFFLERFVFLFLREESEWQTDWSFVGGDPSHCFGSYLV